MQLSATLAANLQHLFRHHQATDTKRSAPASSSSRHLHHQAADTCIPALVFSVAVDQIVQQLPSPRATNLLGILPALRGNIDILPINQGLNKPGHRSSCLYNRCVHIIEHLQQRLRPDYICIKQRHYPTFLDVLSPRTYRQPSLCF